MAVVTLNHTFRKQVEVGEMGSLLMLFCYMQKRRRDICLPQWLITAVMKRHAAMKCFLLILIVLKSLIHLVYVVIFVDLRMCF